MKAVDGRWWLETRSAFELFLFALEATLVAALGPRLGITLPPVTGRMLHRWRYARVIEPLGTDCLYDAERRLVLCGDWCIGARVEAAFLSGTAAAARLLAGC